MCIDATLNQIEGTMSYFQTYRNEGFHNSLVISKEIAEEMGVQPSFPIKRRASRKKQFDETDCEEANLQAEKAFEVYTFWLWLILQLVHWKLDFRNSNHSRVNLGS
jgi:hypothetical protein